MKIESLEVLKGSVVIDRYFDGRFRVSGSVYDEELDDVLEVELRDVDIDVKAYYFVELDSNAVYVSTVKLIDS